MSIDQVDWEHGQANPFAQTPDGTGYSVFFRSKPDPHFARLGVHPASCVVFVDGGPADAFSVARPIVQRQVECVSALAGVADPAKAVERWKRITECAENVRRCHIAANEAAGAGHDPQRAIDSEYRAILSLNDALALPGGEA